MHAAARNIIPAKTLTALPATQKLLSRAEAIANSPCNLLRKESIPNKENPKASVNRLIPVEVCLGFLDMRSYRQSGNERRQRHERYEGEYNNKEEMSYKKFDGTKCKSTGGSSLIQTR
jgi:hypothetical protein